MGATIRGMGLAVLLAGCGGGDDPSAGTPTGAAPAEDWPGGSAGEWGDGDGVQEHWERGSRAGEGDSEDRGGGGPDEGAWDEGGGGPDAGAWDEGAGGGGGWDEGGAGGGGGAWDEEPAAPAEEPGDGPPPPPAEDAEAPAPREPALEGGEIDDNDDFETFLEFVEGALAQFGEDPMVRWLDVRRRHFVEVRDARGCTVPDAVVRLQGDGARSVTGRTRADGRYAWFPAAHDAAADAFEVEASAGGATGRAALDGGEETVVVRLDGARPDDDAFRVDVAFVVDATGSMSEEIDRIKATVTDMAARIGDGAHAPDLRFALVDYRDHGDDYVTHAVNFTRDVAAFQRAVDAVQASGGGDTPEALNEALHETMRRLEWRREATLRLAFVVADAPAHYYEQAPYTYDRAMLDAAAMGVKLFPIASGGSDDVAELQFRQLAQFTLGHFLFVTEGGGSPHGSGGSDYDVDPQDFRVERLDDLVVRLVEAEMDAWHGGCAAAPL